MTGVQTCALPICVRAAGHALPEEWQTESGLAAHRDRLLLPADRQSEVDARRIADGQRRIAALDLYRTVRIDTVGRRDARGAATDTIGLAMTLAESDLRRLRTTAGWGTLDCFRAQARLVDQNAAGTGHRLELTGRLSKIGLDAPFTALRGLCAGDVRNDVFSQRLNYYAGATLRLRNVTSLRDPHVQPEVTLFSERRTVVGAYEQTTDIGAVASATHDVGERLEATVRYAYTNSLTLADQIHARPPEHTARRQGGVVATRPGDFDETMCRVGLPEPVRAELGVQAKFLFAN